MRRALLTLLSPWVQLLLRTDLQHLASASNKALQKPLTKPSLGDRPFSAFSSPTGVVTVELLLWEVVAAAEWCFHSRLICRSFKCRWMLGILELLAVLGLCSDNWAGISSWIGDLCAELEFFWHTCVVLHTSHSQWKQVWSKSWNIQVHQLALLVAFVISTFQPLNLLHILSWRGKFWAF